MKFMFSTMLLLAIALSVGCTIVDGGSVIVGETRLPISPEEVMIYRLAPERYEEIALVSSSAGHDFKKNSSLTNSAVERLKIEAAKLGANGVILSNIDERDAPNVTTSTGSAVATGNGSRVYASGTSTSVNRGDSYTRIEGIAIFVPK